MALCRCVCEVMWNADSPFKAVEDRRGLARSASKKNAVRSSSHSLLSPFVVIADCWPSSLDSACARGSGRPGTDDASIGQVKWESGDPSGAAGSSNTQGGEIRVLRDAEAESGLAAADKAGRTSISVLAATGLARQLLAAVRVWHHRTRLGRARAMLARRMLQAADEQGWREARCELAAAASLARALGNRLVQWRIAVGAGASREHCAVAAALAARRRAARRAVVRWAAEGWPSARLRGATAAAAISLRRQRLRHSLRWWASGASRRLDVGQRLTRSAAWWGRRVTGAAVARWCRACVLLLDAGAAACAAEGRSERHRLRDSVRAWRRDVARRREAHEANRLGTRAVSAVPARTGRRSAVQRGAGPGLRWT